MKKPDRLKEIIISWTIAVCGQYIFSILHEVGHAIACEYFNLEYEIFLWGPWGLKHDAINHGANFIVFLSGGMFAAIILAIIYYIYRKNRMITVGILPLLIFQIVSAIYEGFWHVSYMWNLNRMPYFFGILIVIVFTIFYVRHNNDNKKEGDSGFQ